MLVTMECNVTIYFLNIIYRLEFYLKQLFGE
jgi:hypothetical protein